MHCLCTGIRFAVSEPGSTKGGMYMGFRIITISREFGSGGRTIGKQVAASLGIHFYDSDLVEKIAEESGLTQSYVEAFSEESAEKSSILMGLNRWAVGYGASLSDQLYLAQSKVIRQLAQKHPCVIVGRCGDYILRERTDCLNVLIHADMDFKIERIVRLYGEREDTPVKRIEDKEKRRKAYYKYYTNRSWGQATNYHLCLNSGAIGIDRCTDIIVELARE